MILEKVRISAVTGLFVQDAKAVELRNVKITTQKGEPLKVTDAEVKTS